MADEAIYPRVSCPSNLSLIDRSPKICLNLCIIAYLFIMHRLEDLVQIGEAAKIRGVSIDTLRRWERSGKLKAEKTEGGHRCYRVADLLKVDNQNLRHTVIYGRVSTPDKKEDLARQIGVLELYCQQHGWSSVYTLKDIGSGLNYRKRGLLKLIDLLQRNEVERLLITDKDRLH